MWRVGGDYFAAAIVSPDPRIEVALSVQRALGKAEYSEDELMALQRLAPHVERSAALDAELDHGDEALQVPEIHRANPR